MREISLKKFMHESAFLPPEAFQDEEFMDEWCDKYFGVKYDEELLSYKENLLGLGSD
jgi:hypothetical protein